MTMIKIDKAIRDQMLDENPKTDLRLLFEELLKKKSGMSREPKYLFPTSIINKMQELHAEALASAPVSLKEKIKTDLMLYGCSIIEINAKK